MVPTYTTTVYTNTYCKALTGVRAQKPCRGDYANVQCAYGFVQQKAAMFGVA